MINLLQSFPIKRSALSLLLGFFQFSLIIGINSASAQSNGQVYISVGKAKVKKSLLAIPEFKYFGTGSTQRSTISTKTEIFEVLKNDLDVSNLFVIQSPAAFLEESDNVGLKPIPTETGGFDFKKWNAIRSEFLIKAGFKVVGGNIELESYLYYVPQGKLILGRNYKASQNDARTLAHKFSSDVVEALTGKKAMFDTQFVATANRTGHKEIFTMDWDGANVKQVTKFKNISISPDWSHDNKKVAFTTWAYHPNAKTRNADLFIHDLKSGASPKLVSFRKGINSGANFHPNGKELFLTISKKGNADIYKMNLASSSVTPITSGPNGAMNVEPAISPDGTKLAFSSDRGGRPMIYVMDLKTKSVRQVTRAGHYNATPTWSPDSQRIAFAGFDKAKMNFDIFLMDWNGFNLERLTSGKKLNGKWSNNESPTFSPDGRFIAFTSDRTGNSQIYIINTDGSNERRITKDRYNYEKPKWSSFLAE